MYIISYYCRRSRVGVTGIQDADVVTVRITAPESPVLLSALRWADEAVRRVFWLCAIYG